MVDKKQARRQWLAKFPNAFAPDPAIVQDGGEFVVEGYQHFRIRSPNELTPNGPGLQRKWELISGDISYLAPSAEILDLGANAGFFSVQAALLGAKHVVAVESDAIYARLLREVCARLSLREIEIIEGQVQEYRGEKDVVFALALVHWLFSLTAKWESHLVQHLASFARKALFVEWVDPLDYNIAEFGHVEEADHTRFQQEWFLAQMRQHFPITMLLGETAPYRQMFLGIKGRNDHSRIWIDRPNRTVVKSPTDFLETGIIKREADWLRRLDHLPFVPSLLHEDASELTLEYVGEPLTSANCPTDAEVQGEQIVHVLRENGCQHNDIRPQNLTVSEGQIRLIDFAWATKLGSAPLPAWPIFIGAEYRCTDQLDDLYSMRKCIEAIRSSPV